MIIRSFTTFTIVTSSLLFTEVSSAAPFSKGSVCLTAKDAVVVRARCREGETALTKNLLGSLGVQGVPGPRGPAGPPGPQGSVTPAVVRRADHTLKDGQATSDSQGNVACLDDEIPVTGGANLATLNHGDARLTGSSPRIGSIKSVGVPEDGGNWNIWRATAFNPPGGDTSEVVVRVYMICAPAPGAPETSNLLDESFSEDASVTAVD